MSSTISRTIDREDLAEFRKIDVDDSLIIDKGRTQDPVAARYERCQSEGLSLADTVREVLPLVQHSPRPSSKTAVQERMRMAADFAAWMQEISYSELVYLMHDLLPFEVTYPGWIMAGADAELLLVLLRQELEILQQDVGFNAPGTDELATSIMLTKDIRWMVASTLRESDRFLKPSDYLEAHDHLNQLESIARNLPIKRETFTDIVQLIHSVRRNLERGESPASAIYSVSSNMLLTTSMALERLNDDDQDTIPPSPGHLQDGKRKCTRFTYSCSTDKDGKVVWSFGIGGSIPLPEIPGILDDILGVLEGVFVLLGKGLSSLVIFWLFYDDDDDEQHKERKVNPT